MLISMPFLLITWAVYVLLPERNLHMSALMFYVFSLLMAYTFLLVIQLGITVISEKSDQLCLAIGKQMKQLQIHLYFKFTRIYSTFNTFLLYGILSLDECNLC